MIELSVSYWGVTALIAAFSFVLGMVVCAIILFALASKFSARLDE